MSLFVTILLHAAIILSIIVVHELGHFFAGRIGGVAKHGMRITLWKLPPHVAFADGGHWVGPNQAGRYGELLQQRFPRDGRLFLFVSAGLITQTLYATLLFLVLRVAGLPGIAWMGLSYSAAMVLFYLSFDPILTLITKHQSGDVTAMFALAPGRSLVTLSSIVVLHAVLLILFF